MTERTTVGRTVFVLGGGGALGSYQAGALQALLEHGVVPDAIYGASVGSLNGAYLAHDPLRRELRSWSAGGPASKPGRCSRPRRGSACAALRRRSGVRRAVRRAPAASHDRAACRRARHCRTRDPAAGTTTCLDCARPIQHSQGAIADVLVASCALPGLFPAVRLLDGHRHVDAGVLCGVPVRAAVEAAGPADRIFVLDCALAPVTSRAGCAVPSPSCRRR